ncbi:MAG TPA: polysaccharide biosynthesis/export family protein [Verrucomicrobiae bacterium]
MIDLVANRWPWLAAGAVLCAAALGLLAWKFVGPKFTATAQLLRYATPGISDFFKQDGPMSPETFAGLIQAPDLLQRVGAKANPPIPPQIFARQIKIDPDDASDLVNVAFADRSAQQAVDLLNIYLTNAVEYLRAMQAQEVRQAADSYLSKQVGEMDQDIVGLDKEFHTMALPPQITNKVAQIGGQLNELSHSLATPSRPSPLVAMEMEKLNAAMGELAILLSKDTELNPLVQQKRAEVNALKTQIASDSTNTLAAMPEIAAAAPAAAPAPAPTLNPEVDIIRAKLLSLEEGRVQLVNRQREAELYVANPPGEARVFAPADLKTVRTNHRRMKIAAVTAIGALAGLAGSLILVLLVEFIDGRLKTADDVKRVTRLPVLTALGDMKKMNKEAQKQWAFRAWTLLQGRLAPTAHHGLVCGFTSSAKGEGRSTWIHLLAEAASLTGFRVLTIATRPPGPDEIPGAAHAGDLLSEGLDAKDPSDGIAPDSADKLAQRDVGALNSPGQITEKLTDPNSQPVVHIPLPGWVWNRERRQQWQEALDHWRKIENIVILVELPPAHMPETVLLGSSLPNLVWLADASQARAATTRDQLETLRDARCKLVGAVLNREMISTLRRRFPRWVTCAALLCSLAATAARAQSTNAPAVAAPRTNESFSIVHPWQRAEWQQHLTLGPGDVLNFGLFGQPELAVQEVAIAPDGRVTYLEAQDIMASGLTIDELRDHMDKELGKYYRAPHTMITPVAFRSKRYYMLGKVMLKGAFILDRPITVLEAIARAKGFENGLVDRNVVDLADFSRSFIARGGKRLPLDFEKLFASGDLSQNVPVEPNDYIYIAGATTPEVYVVGEVRLPGPVGYTPNQTIITAIAARGGFTQRAYHSRVLVVRGSFDAPQRFAVDVSDIVRARITDFRLQPKDIIYISPRPFVRVEELADLAATAFIQGFITQWVDTKVIQPFAQ